MFSNKRLTFRQANLLAVDLFYLESFASIYLFIILNLQCENRSPAVCDKLPNHNRKILNMKFVVGETGNYQPAC